MSQVTFEDTLPVSLKTITYRGMTGNEEDMLTDKKLLKQGKAVDKILHACTLELDGDKPSESAISKLTSDDRVFLLVKIREASYDSVIENAEISCPDKNCGNKMLFDIDISELEVTRAEADDTDKVFEVKLPSSNATVKYRHMNGVDEAKLAKQKEDEILTIAMMIRLIEVTESNGEPVHPNRFKNWLKALPVKDRSALRKNMEEQQIGMDTTVVFECDECGKEIKTRVEKLSSFFFPQM
jgi:hypothetical protein